MHGGTGGKDEGEGEREEVRHKNLVCNYFRVQPNQGYALRERGPPDER